MLVMYNPPSSARRKPVMPLALLALGAVLEGRHEYTIVDGNLDRGALETIDGLVRAGADGEFGHFVGGFMLHELLDELRLGRIGVDGAVQPGDDVLGQRDLRVARFL